MKTLTTLFSLIIYAVTASNLQDTSQVPSVLTGPLHKICNFNLNTYYQSSRLEDIKIKKNIIAELKKIGIVHIIDSLKPIDFEKLSNSANLIFKIDEVQNVKNASTPLLRASLSVETDVQIKLSKDTCSCYIWSSNRFVEGDLSKNKEEEILSSFKLLFANFQNDLKEQNKEQNIKIVFNILD